MEEVLQLALNQGIWCALFVILFYWTITENKKREAQYNLTITENQKIIESLTDTIKVDVCTIKTDVEEIKDEMRGKQNV